MSFARYPKYKDSGVDWLGEVPGHWILTKVKRLAARISSGKTPLGGSENYVDDGILFLRSQNVYDEGLRLQDVAFISEGTDESMAVSRVIPGDILLNITGASIGRSCVVPQNFSPANVNQHVCAIRLRDGSQSEALAWVFKSSLIKNQIDLAQNGAAREGLNFEQIGGMIIVIPPPAEQSAIAIFLDRETAKIDALVAEQEKLIALLQEKRQAVISHAVTKGLDSKVPMKYSGVEWLGEVPAHWEVSQLRYVVREGTSITYGIVQAGPEVEDGVPYIRTSDMSGVALPLTGYPKTSLEIDASYARSKVNAGDLVISIRASVGKCLPVPRELDGANLTQGTAKIAPGWKAPAAYMLPFINSEPIQVYLDSKAKGATFKEITLETLRKTPFLLPPLEEQLEIGEWVRNQDHKFQSLIDGAEQAQELLRERRTALISAAVTGQIDVRNA